MGRRVVIWRREEDRQVWLSMLVDAMEEAARPEIRAQPCEQAMLTALRTQLSLPPSPNDCGASALRLQH